MFAKALNTDGDILESLVGCSAEFVAPSTAGSLTVEFLVEDSNKSYNIIRLSEDLKNLEETLRIKEEKREMTSGIFEGSELGVKSRIQLLNLLNVLREFSIGLNPTATFDEIREKIKLLSSRNFDFSESDNLEKDFAVCSGELYANTLKSE